jgi:hypothetical protein
MFRKESSVSFWADHIYIVTDLLKALLSNGSVNMPTAHMWPTMQQYKCFLGGSCHAAVGELCFVRGLYCLYITSLFVARRLDEMLV